MQSTIYLDNAATTRVDSAVVDVMLPLYTEHFGNPSSIHQLGRKSRTLIEKARKQIANHLVASTAEIFFTSGGTESNNTVLKGAVTHLGVERLIISKLEHHCILHSADYLNSIGIDVAYVNNDELGFFDLTHLEELLKASSKKTLVSLIHANNEIGTINDLVAIGNLCKANDTLFHSDTVQTVAHYGLNLQDIPIDFISASAHKFHGPKGVGVLYINGDVALKPFLHGGAQERNMRAGTENLASIVGMAKAMDISVENLQIHRTKISELKNYLKSSLENNFDGINFNGDTSEQSLYTVLNVAFPTSIANDMFMFNLDINGICCSAGSACSSGADTGSHVIQALNKNTGTSSIRFSFSHENTKEEIDTLLDVLKKQK